MTAPWGDPDCPECGGAGYDVFDCDGIGHGSAELQRVDACSCLAVRGFAPDLEGGRPWAVREILDGARES